MFGLRFSALTLDAVTETAFQLAAGPKMRFILPVNVDVLVKFLQEGTPSPFREACLSADMVLADGMPLVWASRLLGEPVPERVAGVDLFLAICDRAASQNRSTFFFGGVPGSAARAEKVIRAQAPSFRVTGIHVPEFGFDSDPVLDARAVSAINAVRPDFLFVALGAPKAEKWIHRHRHDLEVGVVMPVGGAFEMISGAHPRAPGVLQKLGLEWAWRMAHEPRRLWRRYLVDDAAFLRYFLRELLNRTRSNDAESS